MTAQNFESLRARVQALGYQLYVTDKGEQLVIEHRQHPDRLELVFLHCDDEDDDLADWLDNQETALDVKTDTAGPNEIDQSALSKLLRILDGLQDQLRYATGATLMLTESTGIEEYQRDAVGAILDRLRTMTQLVDRLDKWRETIPSLAALGVNSLHEETVAEIREEHPDADERELKLRVAIRESTGMTREEEDAAYDNISKALQCEEAS